MSMLAGASWGTSSTPAPCRVVIAGALLALTLALGCGGGASANPDGGDRGGSSGGGGGAGEIGRGGSGGAGTGAPGGQAGATGPGGTTGAAGLGPGGTSGATGLAGAGGRGGAAGSGAGCIQRLWSVYVQLTDGSIVSVLPPLTTVLDDATGKPLTGVVSLQDNAPTGAGCAALTDGTVRCWLSKTDKDAVGQLGNGSTAATTTTFRATPVVAVGGGPLTNVRAMAHSDLGTGTCAVTNDGKVYCWGDLTWIAGDGTKAIHTGSAQLITIDGTSPLTGVEEIALGNRQACVLRAGATQKEVWCWGYAGQAELGQGNTTNLPHPTKVPGLTNPSAVAIAGAYMLGSPAFADATVCVLESGNIRCWGSNAEGAAGINSRSAQVAASPTPVVDENNVPLDGVTALDVGFGSFSALRSDGSLWLWGHEHSPFARSYATGVVAIGYSTDTGQFGPFFLTSDGVYHKGNQNLNVPCPSP